MTWHRAEREQPTPSERAFAGGRNGRLHVHVWLQYAKMKVQIGSG